MVWREAYRTLLARDLDLPALSLGVEFDVLLGGFDFRAIAQMGVWERLLAADAPDVPWVQVFFLDKPRSDDATLLESIVPPSRIDRSFLVYEDVPAWQDLIQPDRPESAFAAVISGDRARIVMKGLPTEEAWEAFLDEMRSGSR